MREVCKGVHDHWAGFGHNCSAISVVTGSVPSLQIKQHALENQIADETNKTDELWTPPSVVDMDGAKKGFEESAQSFRTALDKMAWTA